MSHLSFEFCCAQMKNGVLAAVYTNCISWHSECHLGTRQRKYKDSIARLGWLLKIWQEHTESVLCQIKRLLALGVISGFPFSTQQSVLCSVEGIGPCLLYCHQLHTVRSLCLCMARRLCSFFCHMNMYGKRFVL